MRYSNPNQLLQSEFSDSVTSHFYPIIQNAYTAYHELIKDSFFNSELKSNVIGSLLSYGVDRQFEKDMLSKSFPLKSSIIRVNNFGRKAILLKSKNAVLTICRTNEPYKLPSKSKYKLQLAKSNQFQKEQLVIDLFDPQRPSFTSEPYYVILTYGGANRELDFLNLLVPDAEMNTYLECVDLRSRFIQYTNNAPKLNEKEIVKLKQGMIKLVNLNENQ
jgi:hypothetical protein